MDLQKVEGILKNFPRSKLLDKGSQKVVFQLDHPEHGPCVLKIGEVSHPNALKRIEREVQTARSIDSIKYPKIFDFQQTDTTMFYILEERKHGVGLNKLLPDFADPIEASKLILNIVEGLELLWMKQIIHRDIKPANLIVGEGNEVFILDGSVKNFV